MNIKNFDKDLSEKHWPTIHSEERKDEKYNLVTMIRAVCDAILDIMDSERLYKQPWTKSDEVENRR